MKFTIGDVVRHTSTNQIGKIVSCVHTGTVAGPIYIVMDLAGVTKFDAYECYLELAQQPVSLATGNSSVRSPWNSNPWTFGNFYPLQPGTIQQASASMATSWEDDQKALKEKRRLEGRCQECGDLLPMSVHGLLDCPKHPKPLPPNHKQ